MLGETMYLIEKDNAITCIILIPIMKDMTVT